MTAAEIDNWCTSVDAPKTRNLSEKCRFVVSLLVKLGTESCRVDAHVGVVLRIKQDGARHSAADWEGFCEVVQCVVTDGVRTTLMSWQVLGEDSNGTAWLRGEGEGSGSAGLSVFRHSPQTQGFFRGIHCKLQVASLAARRFSRRKRYTGGLALRGDTFVMNTGSQAIWRKPIFLYVVVCSKKNKGGGRVGLVNCFQVDSGGTMAVRRAREVDQDKFYHQDCSKTKRTSFVSWQADQLYLWVCVVCFPAGT